METTQSTNRKRIGFLRRAFRPVADAAAQAMVDAEINRTARRHQAISLFSPTFKSWNR